MLLSRFSSYCCLVSFNIVFLIMQDDFCVAAKHYISAILWQLIKSFFLN